MRALKICMTRPKSCAPAADALPTAWNFIWPRPAPKCRRKSESNGDWKTLIDAGAIPLPPGCGACIGLGRGLVQKGETAISATNRNFKGRMGDRDALVYFGSPAVVAASALAGFICAPTNFNERAAGTAIRRPERKRGQRRRWKSSTVFRQVCAAGFFLSIRTI